VYNKTMQSATHIDKDIVKTGKLYLAYITRLTEWQLVNNTVT